MVDAVYMLPIGGVVAQVGQLGQKLGDHLCTVLHSSNEQGQLCHDDSTINIVIIIMIYNILLLWLIIMKTNLLISECSYTNSSPVFALAQLLFVILYL